jgi:hypothetical protein
VQITRVGGLNPVGVDVFVTGRTGFPYQNACNGDSRLRATSSSRWPGQP